MTPEQIRTFRKQLGLTQTEFANLIALTRSQIAALEGGRYNPSPQTALLISLATGVPAALKFLRARQNE